VADTSPRRWGSNWTNPLLYVLPQAIGGMPAGTILLAGIIPSHPKEGQRGQGG
jgi:hypothetical protein